VDEETLGEELNAKFPKSAKKKDIFNTKDHGIRVRSHSVALRGAPC
jgi:hypothetical protein